ncbi:hypothetical protein N752_03050 [Desulforamulus aquiferis]|nr:hypothetical protein N752_03050 [Desulforamulus aquiferis]
MVSWDGKYHNHSRSWAWGPEFLTRAGARALAKGEILIGAPRLLASFLSPGQESYPLGSDLEAATEYIRSNYQIKRVVVLVSGDPGFYSLAAFIRNRFPEEVLEFIPGISSIQLMFARLKQPWQDVAFISRHGRQDQRLLGVLQAGLVAAVLTDKVNTPQGLAAELLAGGCSDLPVSVGCNLSLETEYLYRGSLSQLKDYNKILLNCVVVIGV